MKTTAQIDVLQQYADWLGALPKACNAPFDEFKTRLRQPSVLQWALTTLNIQTIDPLQHKEVCNAVRPEVFVMHYKQDPGAWLEWCAYIEQYANTRRDNTMHRWMNRWLDEAISYTEMENAGSYHLDLHCNHGNVRIRDRLATLQGKISWFLEFYQTQTMQLEFWGSLSSNTTYQDWLRDHTTTYAYAPPELGWMHPILAIATHWFPEHAETFARLELSHTQLVPRSEEYVRAIEETVLGKAIDWKRVVHDLEPLILEFKPTFVSILAAVTAREFDRQTDTIILNADMFSTAQA